MPQAVTFDYAAWIARFPEFAAVSQPMAQGYFDDAGSYCANDTCNPAFAVTVYQGSTATTLLARLLNMLTAHVAWLSAPRDANGNPSSTGQNPSPLVGRISSASEGSVNVSVELAGGDQGPSFAYFSQSQYGLAYWQASAQFRTAIPVLNPRTVVNGAYPSFPYVPRGGW